MPRLLLPLGLLLCAGLFAASPAGAAGTEPLSMGTALLRTVWALCLVAGLILALYGLARKRLFSGRPGGKTVTILELHPLPQKTALALVRVRDREYLLGVGGNGVRLLAELPPEKEEGTDFATLLDQHKQA